MRSVYAAAELGRNPVIVSTRFSLSMQMSRLTRDGTAEPVSRDQILRREQRGQGNIYFPCSADHMQDWQPYPRLIPTLAMCVTMHAYNWLACDINAGLQEKLRAWRTIFPDDADFVYVSTTVLQL